MATGRVSPKRKNVSMHLTEMWNRYCKKHGRGPRWIIMGRDLMAKYESELMWMARFVSYEPEPVGRKILLFKSSKVIADKPGWHYKFTNVDPRDNS